MSDNSSSESEKDWDRANQNSRGRSTIKGKTARKRKTPSTTSTIRIRTLEDSDISSPENASPKKKMITPSLSKNKKSAQQRLFLRPLAEDSDTDPTYKPSPDHESPSTSLFQSKSGTSSSMKPQKKSTPRAAVNSDPKATKKRSEVWQFFDKMGNSRDGKKQAACKECGKIYIRHEGSTRNLWYHLKNEHEVDQQKINPPNPKESKYKQTKISFPDEKKYTSAEAIYTELICLDGISINKCATSNFIQESVEQRGFVSYSRPQTISTKVKQEVSKEKETVKENLTKNIINNERYSLTFDEYTSLRNRRYLTINVHGANGEVINLGLVRVLGSQTSDSLIEIIKDRLKKFGLSLDQVVYITTDGASIMIKLGKNVQPVHQVCIAHAIHLAVCDVIYKKKKKKRLTRRRD